MLKVSTGGTRNERSLTDEEYQKAKNYAVSLGFPSDRIMYNDYDCTAYGECFDILRIGTDVYPGEAKTPNARISMKGAIAHELIGHREAHIKGWTQKDDMLEEVQASIRAARFTPDLSESERQMLARDALYRLKRHGKKINEVKQLLNIDRR